MRRYRISSATTGRVFGVFDGASPAEAIEACAGHHATHDALVAVDEGEASTNVPRPPREFLEEGPDP